MPRVLLRARRGGGGLDTLVEDGHHSEDEETDLGDSPCPPPTNRGTKGKRIGRAPALMRSETYDPSRFAY